MYLVRNRLKVKVYHLFDGEDTACKLWTTSNMRKDLYKIRKNVDDLLSVPSWEQKNDTQYTTGSRFAITGGAASVVLPNNGLNVINTYIWSYIN